ncbi:heat shock 70 kDa protein cognate 2 [Histomonas meleagridis]|uniref:heat shock 70 kDa protein cognate 2 n=1 Tax=Histomonas meleagridis TaxID=135588 RepID=UPI00355A2A42|nr:heat shock 70 kDa protein cognate 2 [Histomonas meleagridis]KAH0803870.1 heat shock 70 kDa protein cognate 2 [Histomonas meleagridis]
MKKQKVRYILGIDLGTTYSSVAVYKNNEVEIIPINSKLSIPSYVTFTEDGQVLCGYVAKDQASQYLNSTVFDSKRLIGRKFTDPIIKECKDLWPFTVVQDGGVPKIKIQFQNSQKIFLPEEISSEILKELKGLAEDFYSVKIDEAVITIPADFNSNQRQATRKAGELAGLKVLRLIEEPTAAAIACGLKENSNYNNKKILIFDFGGGTLDVSILNVDKNDFQVIATDGDPHLGGQDFDNNLLHYVAKCFKEKHNCDFLQNKRSVLFVKDKCEEAKIVLAKNQKTTISCPSLCGIDYKIEIKREEFESINSELFDRILNPVKRVLEDKGLFKENIDDYILIGGSSKIPKVRSILREYFGKEPLNLTRVHPELAVVSGAAILGGDIAGNEYPIVRIRSVLPHSLGVELYNGEMQKIIAKNTNIPIEVHENYTTASDYQNQIKISVFMGEDQTARNNSFLGEFLMGGITNGKIGEPKITVTFKVDEEGILKVSALDTKTGAYKEGNMKNVLHIM